MHPSPPCGPPPSLRVHQLWRETGEDLEEAGLEAFMEFDGTGCFPPVTSQACQGPLSHCQTTPALPFQTRKNSSYVRSGSQQKDLQAVEAPPEPLPPPPATSSSALPHVAVSRCRPLPKISSLPHLSHSPSASHPPLLTDSLQSDIEKQSCLDGSYSLPSPIRPIWDRQAAQVKLGDYIKKDAALTAYEKHSSMSTATKAKWDPHAARVRFETLPVWGKRAGKVLGAHGQRQGAAKTPQKNLSPQKDAKRRHDHTLKTRLRSLTSEKTSKSAIFHESLCATKRQHHEDMSRTSYPFALVDKPFREIAFREQVQWDTTSAKQQYMSMTSNIPAMNTFAADGSTGYLHTFEQQRKLAPVHVTHNREAEKCEENDLTPRRDEKPTCHDEWSAAVLAKPCRSQHSMNSNMGASLPTSFTSKASKLSKPMPNIGVLPSTSLKAALSKLTEPKQNTTEFDESPPGISSVSSSEVGESCSASAAPRLVLDSRHLQGALSLHPKGCASPNLGKNANVSDQVYVVEDLASHFNLSDCLDKAGIDTQIDGLMVESVCNTPVNNVCRDNTDTILYRVLQDLPASLDIAEDREVAEIVYSEIDDPNESLVAESPQRKDLESQISEHDVRNPLDHGHFEDFAHNIGCGEELSSKELEAWHHALGCLRELHSVKEAAVTRLMVAGNHHNSKVNAMRTQALDSLHELGVSNELAIVELQACCGQSPTRAEFIRSQELLRSMRVAWATCRQALQELAKAVLAHSQISKEEALPQSVGTHPDLAESRSDLSCYESSAEIYMAIKEISQSVGEGELRLAQAEKMNLGACELDSDLAARSLPEQSQDDKTVSLQRDLLETANAAREPHITERDARQFLDHKRIKIGLQNTSCGDELSLKELEAWHHALGCLRELHSAKEAAVTRLMVAGSHHNSQVNAMRTQALDSLHELGVSNELAIVELQACCGQSPTRAEFIRSQELLRSMRVAWATCRQALQELAKAVLAHGQISKEEALPESVADIYLAIKEISQSVGEGELRLAQAEKMNLGACELDSDLAAPALPGQSEGDETASFQGDLLATTNVTRKREVYNGSKYQDAEVLNLFCSEAIENPSSSEHISKLLVEQADDKMQQADLSARHSSLPFALKELCKHNSVEVVDFPTLFHNCTDGLRSRQLNDGLEVLDLPAHAGSLGMQKIVSAAHKRCDDDEEVLDLKTVCSCLPPAVPRCSVMDKSEAMDAKLAENLADQTSPWSNRPSIASWLTRLPPSLSVTSLHVAIKAGRVQDVANSLVAGIPPNCLDRDGIAPLHLAAEIGSTNMIIALIEARASPNIRTRNFSPPHTGISPMLWKLCDGITPLHVAALSGSVEIVDYLLQARAAPNLGRADGICPLHFAVQGGHDRVIRSLLVARASPQVQSIRGFTPLHDAADLGHSGIVNTLLKGGANLNAVASEGVTPLHAASQRGFAEIVTLLLANGASSKAASTGGFTPLHDSAHAGRLEATRCLLLARAHVHKQSDGGATPLHLAAQAGHKQVALALVAARALPEAHGSNGVPSPLQLAAHRGHRDVVLALHRCVSSKSKSGM